MPTKNKRDGTITLQDKLENSIIIAFEEGDLSWSEEQPCDTVLDRGSIVGARRTDDMPVTGSFSTKYVQLLKQTTEGNPTAYEAMTFSGAASSWVSTLNCNNKVQCITIIYTIASKCDGEEGETITFNYCHCNKVDFSESDESSLTFDFTDYEIKPTIAKT